MGTPADLPAEFGLPAEYGLPTEDELEARAHEFFRVWGVLDRLAHVEVRWNRRLRTTAGCARPKTLRIDLNPTLLARVPEAVDEVLAHEAAHLAAVLLHGLRVPEHGEAWQELMRRVGHAPNPTHDFPIHGLSPRYHYLHVCSACGRRDIGSRSAGDAPCGCGSTARATFRAPRTPAGRAALEAHPGAAPEGPLESSDRS